MNRKLIYILSGSLLVLVVILLIFVFKVNGSSSMDNISGCIPYNVSISKGDTDHIAVVEWSTTDSCVGYVMYGDDRDSLDLVGIDTGNLSSKKHYVEINNLLSSKTYYFVVNSGGTNYGNNGVALSFSLSSL